MLIDVLLPLFTRRYCRPNLEFVCAWHRPGGTQLTHNISRIFRRSVQSQTGGVSLNLRGFSVRVRPQADFRQICRAGSTRQPRQSAPMWMLHCAPVSYLFLIFEIRREKVSCVRRSEMLSQYKIGSQ